MTVQNTTSRTAYWREYARKNPDKIRAKKAAYRARNKAKIAAAARAYREANAGVPKAPSYPKPKPTKLDLLRKRFLAFRAEKRSAA